MLHSMPLHGVSCPDSRSPYQGFLFFFFRHPHASSRSFNGNLSTVCVSQTQRADIVILHPRLSRENMFSEKVMPGMLLTWLGHPSAPKRRAAGTTAVRRLAITANTLEMQLVQGIRPMWSLPPKGFPGLISLLLLHPHIFATPG